MVLVQEILAWWPETARLSIRTDYPASGRYGGGGLRKINFLQD